MEEIGGFNLREGSNINLDFDDIRVRIKSLKGDSSGTTLVANPRQAARVVINPNDAIDDNSNIGSACAEVDGVGVSSMAGRMSKSSSIHPTSLGELPVEATMNPSRSLVRDNEGGVSSVADTNPNTVDVTTTIPNPCAWSNPTKCTTTTMNANECTNKNPNLVRKLIATMSKSSMHGSGVSLTGKNPSTTFGSFSSSVGGSYPNVFGSSNITSGLYTTTKFGSNNTTNAQTSSVNTTFYEPSSDSPIVHSAAINLNPSSYAKVMGASNPDQPRGNFRSLVADKVFEGVNISIPLKVVQKVSVQFENTLYGYFIGKRMAFLVVEYYARNNWGKHGLKRIMMNAKGFFFFKFDRRAGLDAILEGGPWMIRNSLIILKKWSMNTSLQKEELTRISIWVKLHDVPLQVIEEDGISLIATYLGKPIMLDSYTSSIIPNLEGPDFTKETIRVEYEWKPPRCPTCNIFGHTADACPKKVVISLVVNDTNDGFQRVVNKKRNNKKSTTGNQIPIGVSVAKGFQVGKQFNYQPKAPSVGPNGCGTRGEASSKAGLSKDTNEDASKKGISTDRQRDKDVVDMGVMKMSNIENP
ncbi:zinc knuckle CX2CX4HX4C containing protein [Tanacetum coccineum]